MEASTASGVTFEKPSHWWALALIGAFQVITGIVALAYPGVTLLALGIIFGVNLLMAGFVMLVIGTGDETVSGGMKAMRIVLGMLTELAGLLCIVRPGASVLVLLLCLSFWFIVTGSVSLLQAIHNPEHRAINAILGLIGIAAGIVVVGDPDVGLSTLADLAGIILIIRGTIEIMAGFLVRSQQSEA